jgi:hypothetical protein
MKVKSVLIVIGLVLIAAPYLWAGTGIQAGVSLSGADLKPGEQATVSVSADLTNLSGKLGSYTATLSWNASVLKYVSAAGAAGPFANPVLNDRASAEGKLSFAAANPKGAQGKVGLINVTFEVIGNKGSAAGLALKFSALAASSTFKDLLPELHVTLEDLTVAQNLPTSFSLSQNHPNPFNPTTRIEFALPEESLVSVEIYNLLGEKVRILVNEKKEAGNFNVIWDSKDNNGIEMPAGVYLIQMKAGSFSDMKKMMLVK